jgi:type I restriction enzyme M protein
VPTGFITAQSGIEKGIREHLVKNKMLSGVISMPSNIFATTGTNVSILFMDANNKDNVILIDASNLGEKVKEGKNQKTVLCPEEEKQIIETFNNKRVVENVSVVVSYDEIEAKNYSLSAGQYFDAKVEHVAITPQQFDKQLAERRERLKEMFNDARNLEVDIESQLGGLQL